MRTTAACHFCELPVPRTLESLVRAEYREMPGLTLTLAQAARLWNVDRRQCLAVLEELRDEGFLEHDRDSYFRPQ